MDALLLEETAFAFFSDRLKMEGYSSNDIAIMWAAKSAFREEIAKAHADAARALLRTQELMQRVPGEKGAAIDN